MHAFPMHLIEDKQTSSIYIYISLLFEHPHTMSHDISENDFQDNNFIKLFTTEFFKYYVLPSTQPAKQYRTKNVGLKSL